MKPKILVTRDIFSAVLTHLREHAEVETGYPDRNLTRQELITGIRDKEGLLSLLVDEIDREVMDAAPGLRIIANCAVGYNNIDINHAAKRGIVVTNTPGILTETTADLTWALILGVARKISLADRFTREEKFKGWELDLFLGQEITGKCLGIIGFGRIGRAVAIRAQAFRMKVIYTDPHPLSAEEEEHIKTRHVTLDELLSEADIISIHASLTPQSRHLITTEKIRLMKKNAILVNVARGPIIDEKALADALERRNIWGAGLDVYEREPEIEAKLFNLDNVVLLPHIGSATYETRNRMAMTAARNLIQALRGERPDNLVA